MPLVRSASTMGWTWAATAARFGPSGSESPRGFAGPIGRFAVPDPPHATQARTIARTGRIMLCVVAHGRPRPLRVRVPTMRFSVSVVLLAVAVPALARAEDGGKTARPT